MFSSSLLTAVLSFSLSLGASAQSPEPTLNTTEPTDTTTTIADSSTSTRTPPPLTTVFFPDGEEGVSNIRWGRASPEASTCEGEWSQWVIANQLYGLDHSFIKTVTETVVETTSEVTDRRVTTLCDGHARYVDPEIVVIPPTTIVKSSETYEYPEMPSPKPTCSIGSEDCSILTTSYLSARSLWVSLKDPSITSDAFNNRTDMPVYPSTMNFWESWRFRSWLFSDAPGCTTAPPLTDTCGFRCRVRADQARLMYFPVSVVGGLCGNRSTITPTPTIPGRPNTAVVDGTTYTSGYVYLSFNAASAHSWDGRYAAWGCGETRTNAVISIRSEELSSVGKFSAGHMYGGPYPFQFGDFDNGPAPFTVFEHKYDRTCGPLGDRCVFGNETDENCVRRQSQWCSTFTAPASADWFPSVDIPPQVTEIDPLWRSCEPDFMGVQAIPYAFGSGSQLTEVRAIPTPESEPLPSIPIDQLVGTEDLGPSLVLPASSPRNPGPPVTGSPTPGASATGRPVRRGRRYGS